MQNMDKADGCCWFFSSSWCCPNALVYNGICARTENIRTIASLLSPLDYHITHHTHTWQQVICANVRSIDNCSCCCCYLTPNLPLESACTFDTQTLTNEYCCRFFFFCSLLFVFFLSAFLLLLLFPFILPFINVVHFDKWSIFMKEQQQHHHQPIFEKRKKWLVALYTLAFYVYDKKNEMWTYYLLKKNKENE